ncbi:predicted protein, partial [Nematostella vectensis]
CPPGCPKILRHVCGSDGTTYDNSCLLRLTACQQKKRIRVRGFGHCHGKPVCVCPPGCPSEVKPVCGTDGVTYDNLCSLRLKACTDNTRTRFKAFGECACVCPPKCEKVYDPVYGSDGKNYDNECELKRAACTSNRRIILAGRGRDDDKPACVCPPKCEKVYDPVYGSDGKNYDNECELKRAACTSNRRIILAGRGRVPCVCPPGCSKILKRVRGSDGKIYDNECLLKLAAC